MLGDDEQGDGAVSTVGITAPSAPHMTFGAAVVIAAVVVVRRTGRAPMRGEQAVLAHAPQHEGAADPDAVVTRSRAQTLRCPSPARGATRSRRIAASRSSSPSAGSGPRRPAGLSGGCTSWRRAS